MMRRFFCVPTPFIIQILLLFAFVLGPGAGVQQVPAKELKLLQHLGGAHAPLAARNQYVYLKEGCDLVTLDAADPAAPREVGRLRLGGVINALRVAGATAYVCDGGRQLYRFDLSGGLPSALPPVQASERIDTVWLGGDVAYLADPDGGVRVLDLSDPTSPTLGGRKAGIGRVFTMLCRERKALILAAGSVSAYHLVLDATTPAQPTVADFNSIEYGTPEEAVLVGQYIYAQYTYTRGPFGIPSLWRFNASNLTCPSIFDQLTLGGEFINFTTVGNQVYCLQQIGSYGIPEWRLVRIDNANTLRFSLHLGPTLALPGGQLGAMTASSQGLCALGSTAGLTLIDAANMDTSRVAGHYGLLGVSYEAMVEGQNLYARGDRGLTTFDLADPRRPAQQGNQPAKLAGNLLAVRGRLGYAASGKTLSVLDLADPTSPSLKGLLELQDNVSGFELAGSLACAADKQVQVVDLSDPAQPRLQGTLPLTDNFSADDVALDGQTAYLCDYGAVSPLGRLRLKVVDLANPSSPTLKADCLLSTYSLGMDSPRSRVAVRGGRAYLANANFGLAVLDVRQPSQPKVLAQGLFGNVTDVAVAPDGVVYIVQPGVGVKALDLSQVDKPFTLATFSAPGLSEAQLTLRDGLLLVNDKEAGLYILDALNTSAAAPAWARYQ